jgi:hypothetical protein
VELRRSTCVLSNRAESTRTITNSNRPGSIGCQPVAFGCPAETNFCRRNCRNVRVYPCDLCDPWLAFCPKIRAIREWS